MGAGELCLILFLFLRFNSDKLLCLKQVELRWL